MSEELNDEQKEVKKRKARAKKPDTKKHYDTLVKLQKEFRDYEGVQYKAMYHDLDAKVGAMIRYLKVKARIND